MDTVLFVNTTRKVNKGLSKQEIVFKRDKSTLYVFLRRHEDTKHLQMTYFI